MSIYDFTAKDNLGKDVPLSTYQNKVLLIINSATACGFTPQYEELQNMYDKYNEQGFEILDFPCNQFGNQAPGSIEEIKSFCDLKFGTKFPLFEKIDVNGPNAHPLYKYLTSELGFDGFDPNHKLTSVLEEMLEKQDPNYKNDPSIKWNFTKFVINRSGEVVERFEPTKDISQVEAFIQNLL